MLACCTCLGNNGDSLSFLGTEAAACFVATIDGMIGFFIGKKSAHGAAHRRSTSQLAEVNYLRFLSFWVKGMVNVRRLAVPINNFAARKFSTGVS